MPRPRTTVRVVQAVQPAIALNRQQDRWCPVVGEFRARAGPLDANLNTERRVVGEDTRASKRRRRIRGGRWHRNQTRVSLLPSPSLAPTLRNGHDTSSRAPRSPRDTRAELAPTHAVHLTVILIAARHARLRRSTSQSSHEYEGPNRARRCIGVADADRTARIDMVPPRLDRILRSST